MALTGHSCTPHACPFDARPSCKRLTHAQPFVANAEQLLGLSRRVLGARAATALIKHSFFGHFCAGAGRQAGCDCVTCGSVVCT